MKDSYHKEQQGLFRFDSKQGPPKTVTYTQAATFKKCPFEYKHRFLLTSRRRYDRWSSRLQMGIFLHLVLRDFFSISEVEKRTEQVLINLAVRRWSKTSLLKRGAAKYRFDLVETALRKFYGNNDCSILPAMLEQTFEARFQNENFYLKGKLDRVDKTKDGYQIIEYKLEDYREDTSASETDLQVDFYCLAFKCSFLIQPESFRYYFLDTGKTLSIPTSALNMNSAFKRIKRIVTDMLTVKRFPTRPNPLCKDCSVHHCPIFKNITRKGGR